MNWLTKVKNSSSQIAPGVPVRRTTGSMQRMKMIFSRFVPIRIFFLPYLRIRNGATRFGQKLALPAIAVITAYCPAVAAP